MEPAANPFAVLSLIVAPAMLTNASSVLIMSTSTRLARAVDRARELAAKLEEAGAHADDRSPVRLAELTAVEGRALMLLHALRSFYVSLGGFASATLISLLGATLTGRVPNLVTLSIEIVAVVAGLVAVGGLVRGALLLVRETRIAVNALQDEAAQLRASFQPHPDSAARAGKPRGT